MVLIYFVSRLQKFPPIIIFLRQGIAPLNLFFLVLREQMKLAL